MIPTIVRCSVTACDRPVIAGGVCDMHYRRMKRHGHFEQTRPGDWGDRRKHPLYKYWTQIRRNGMPVCELWHTDFWAFSEAVGERPSMQHTIYRPDQTKPVGPGNAAWAESKAGPARDETHTNERSRKTNYMRDYNQQRREADPLLQMRIGLDRSHGITLDEYEAMMDVQGGLCYICGRSEHRLAVQTGQPMRLAVDHCHATGDIRGLLCSFCNHAIGYLEDSPVMLQRAIEYLQNPPAAALGIKHNGKHKARRLERPPSPYLDRRKSPRLVCTGEAA